MALLLHQPVLVPEVVTLQRDTYTQTLTNPHTHTPMLERGLNLTFILRGSAPHLHAGRQNDGDYCDEELIPHFLNMDLHTLTGNL